MDRNCESTDKRRSEGYVIDMFGHQGLGQSAEKKTILLLDTPMLLTTLLLSERYFNSINKIIIVEKDAYTKRCIAASAKKLRHTLPPVEVVHGEVMRYLRTTSEQIDFAWLDLMTDRPREIYTALPRVNSMRCIALTIAGRSNSGKTAAERTLAARITQLTSDLSLVDMYKNLAWGYVSSGYDENGNPTRGSPMHVVAYGKREMDCLYRPRNVRPIEGRDGWVEVEWYGEPGVWTIEKGTYAEWMYGMNEEMH